MGNKDSKHDHHSDLGHTSESERKSERNKDVETAFKQWTERHGGVNKETMQRVFGPMLGPIVWRYLRKSSDEKNLSIDEFETKCVPLVFGNNDAYFRMMAGDGIVTAQVLTEIIHVCRASAGVEFKGATDEKLIDAVISTVISSKDKVGVDELRNWIETTCPRLTSSLKRTVGNGMQTATTTCDKWNGPRSKFLSPMKIWLIQCCVPSFLIRPETASLSDQMSDANMPSSASWDLLYSSEDDGLSPNRFETKVFNYRSPTVTVVELRNGDLYCLCNDEEWNGCAVYKINPRVELLESGGVSGMIFFNKQRGLPQGLFVGSNPKKPHFQVDTDFSNLRSIEVWGCGSPESYTEQQNQRQWEKRQVEKQQKVPLPGNWEDSPDRMLLEMGGVQTQHAER